MSQSIYIQYHYTYIITNTNTQMKYIGVRSCNCLPENDSGYMGSSKSLDKAMNETPETFTKIIIDTFPTREIANIDEQRLHEMYDVARNPEFYNLMNAPLGFCTSGKTHSPETRKKIGEAGMGRKHSLKTRNEMSESRMRKNLSLETRKKLSKSTSGENNSMYGKKHSPESLKKMSEAQSGENNPLYGKHHSAETRAKMSKPQTKITCPHCSKTGGDRNMKRYHFDNCKEISTIF